MHRILLAILVVLILLLWFAPGVEMYTGPAGPIIEAIQKNETQRGSFVDFRKMIGDPNFSPHMYTKLVAAARDGKLTVANVDKILAEK